VGTPVIGRWLLDNSAFSRLWDSRLSDDRVAEIAQAVEDGRIVACLPFLLEAGYSARDLETHEDLLAELLAFPSVGFDALAEQRAVDAQRELAAVGHHRVPPVDVLIAALADRHGLGILHYDGDYDAILARTSLDFESTWLTERGSL
jgi:predicted nucleic acid-binding protein